MGIVILILQGVGALISLVALYLVVVAIVPGISVRSQPFPRRDQQDPGAGLAAPPNRTDVEFDVQEATVRAWLYLPEDRSRAFSCIVMGHGFGGTKDTRLEPYAERFQHAGFAVLVFDYRHFGESGGEPRQLLWIPSQLEDWAAAVAYARGIDGVDPEKIALWGTSLSGAHVLVTAAKDHRIACVTAQCPGLDSRAAAEVIVKRAGIRYMLRMIVHGQRDLVRSWLGLSPHKIPIVGRPGTIAALSMPGAWEGFEALIPDGFVNEVCARIVIRGDKYRPSKYASHVQCPILVQLCDEDNLVPPSTADETIEKLGQYAEVVHYPIGHFDVYVGDAFERSVSDQLAFFTKHMGTESFAVKHNGSD